MNEGAAVRVSLICFSQADPTGLKLLDDRPVELIAADLTPLLRKGISTLFNADDLTQAKQLSTNANVSFIGTQKNGSFDIAGEMARNWLTQPNPHNMGNVAVLKPWANGINITRRNTDTWIIDFLYQFPNVEVEVYNRWGEQLFYSKGYAVPFNGQYKGKDLPVGTYYYIVNLNHEAYPKPFTSPLTIFR